MPRRSSPISVLVVAAAIFLRLWVPAGWMPATGAGFFAIQPCQAAQPLPMVHAMAADHGEGTHGHSDHGHETATGDCSFAPLQASNHVPAAAVIAPLPAVEPLALGSVAIDLPFSTGPPAPPPPATGPPLIA